MMEQRGISYFFHNDSFQERKNTIRYTSHSYLSMHLWTEATWA